jgi:MPBQ/MSBQ methyltransferase
MISSTTASNELYAQIAQGQIKPTVGAIGFLNVGYWKHATDNIEIAQINLIETLLEFLSGTTGRVLDVACGNGASTRFLTKYFEPHAVTGINTSEVQLQNCRAAVPECNFRLMDAASLDFADCSFDGVLCIQSAHHFLTRRRFLEEAFRILKPNGRLAMHDLFFHDPDHPNAPDAKIWPRQNYLASVDEYRFLLSSIGFAHVRAEDITQFSEIARCEWAVKRLEKEFTRKPDSQALATTMTVLNGTSPWAPSNCTFCMAYAIK